MFGRVKDELGTLCGDHLEDLAGYNRSGSRVRPLSLGRTHRGVDDSEGWFLLKGKRREIFSRSHVGRKVNAVIACPVITVLNTGQAK